jgi:(E)-4-hydroxy-3-methylbut-2-enyl-diphosphate synthase
MDFFNYHRRQTIEVQVGNTTIGCTSPIRVQTMANTDTNDIEASVEQTIRIVNAKSELLRYTTQGKKEVANLSTIKNKLRGQNIDIPLVADVHFNPDVAMAAAEVVEKVRINPGNFVKSKTNSIYTEEEFLEEKCQIRKKIIPLIEICKNNNTAIRIGVNHGSLSPRIVSKFGDTPSGLAESCIEFLEMFEHENFHNIVLSIKASNPIVMIYAVRLLVAKMDEKNMHYPLHLGVTEAGNGEDGRIKSAVGIGTLLADGYGDTIRISLSEEPEKEIPVAKKLVEYVSQFSDLPQIKAETYNKFNFFEHSRRKTYKAGKTGGGNPVAVIAEHNSDFGDLQPDFILTDNSLNFIKLGLGDLNKKVIDFLINNPEKIILLQSLHKNRTGEMKAFFHKLMIEKILNPVIIALDYEENSLEDLQIKASIDFARLLIEGFGDGIMISNKNENITEKQLVTLSFDILQATRTRISKNDYIACPSCGRTMFDLQFTLENVKKATSHLKNLKIAVMGCIVNGIGEMADADYGYVGAGKGKVSLYKGKTCIEKNIPEEKAIEKLLKIINSE